MTRSTAGERIDARRAEIRIAASRLFRQRGFAQVGIDDIGAAVGVSGPAVYRYFPSKQALLAAVLIGYLEQLRLEFESQTRLVSVGVKRAARGVPVPQGDRVLSSAIAVGLRDPDGLVVYLRQVGNLESQFLEQVATERSKLSAGWDRFLPAVENAVDAASQQHLRMRCIAGVLTHFGLTKSSTPRFRDELAASLVTVILATPLSSQRKVPGSAARSDSPRRLTHVTRREAILAAAVELMRARGFTAVSLNDIGAEVGITASAVMRHFDSKEHLLGTAVNRVGEQIASGIATALRSSVDEEQAVLKIVSMYADLAGQCRDLVAVHTTEVHFLSEVYHAERRKRQRMYIDELAHVIQGASPGMSPQEGRLRAGAVYAMINESIMSDVLAQHASTVGDLRTLALAVTRDVNSR
ncbi:TetR/AcrR family transcriptional regulator [Rhodococcus sp. KBS0724]|uniref:TetR/AcrR family transcriptional regulator n=1 Tax=Rhodococcus sp. KBS0724 TaxID=1179674 RepID=UPI00110E5CF2|nr:TetR/AcrR family transcriptional regulator [Rhodococcus sp. KBS0724]TSD40328.1 TetR/AcrR family transcriptional regulator [Rhodococcus sp. KBS0724]